MTTEEKKEEEIKDEIKEEVKEETKDEIKEEVKEETKDEKDNISSKEEVSKISEINPGMIVRVHQKIKELDTKGKEKERIQVFEGMVIAHHAGLESGATFTVRKVTKKGGVAVEKIFPLSLPTITKIEIVKKHKVRRSKLYFLRGKYKKKMKEIKE